MASEAFTVGHLRELGGDFWLPAVAPPSRSVASSRPPAQPAGAEKTANAELFSFQRLATGASATEMRQRYPLLNVDLSHANVVNTDQETPAENLQNFDANFVACLGAMADAGLFRGPETNKSTTLYLHPPVYTCEQASKFGGGNHPHAAMKNLFLKDKKKNLFLVSALVDTEVQLKKLRPKGAASGGLSFASYDDLFEVLGLLPGSVTPFGLLNDKEKKVTWCLDENALTGEQEFLGFHPNACNATLGVHRDVLTRFIEEVTGHEVHVLSSGTVVS